MNLKERFPASVIAAGRLVRTWATLRGMYDCAERPCRLAAVRAMAAQRPTSPRGRRVLLFSLRGWYPHVAWESVLAHALRLRGVTVHVFSCGGPLPICEVNFRGADPRVACIECAAYPRALVRDLGLPQSWLRNYVAPREQAAVRAEVAALAPAEYEDWTFDAQPIGRLVRDSVCWFLRKSGPDLALASDVRVYRDFLIAGAGIALLAPRLLDATRPDVVLELNGQFFAERILNRFAAPRAAVVTYEASWRHDMLGFDRLSPSGPVDIDRPWAALRNSPLMPAQEEELDRWIAERETGDMQRDFFIRFDCAEVGSVLARLGLREDSSTAVLFTNVVWDTAVLGRDVSFPSIADWLRQTLQIFAGWPQRQLVVRIHPAEELRPSMAAAEKLATLVEQAGPLPRNIKVVGARDTTSTYALMHACDVGLVYTSTAGLEMALRAKPVVVAGRPYYRGRGFTVDVDRSADYASQLEAAFTQRSVDFVLARRFAHLLLFRYLYRVPVVRQRPASLPLLDAGESDLLGAGATPAFERLVEALAAGAGFVGVEEAPTPA